MLLFLGNAIGLIAATFTVFIGLIKSKEKMLATQTVQISLFVIADAVLGGISGVIVNVLGAIRNILCSKNLLTKNIKIIFIIANIVLGLVFNNSGIIGLFPVISAVIYILYMDEKDISKFKLLVAVTMFLWLIYDLSIKLYVSSILDTLGILTNLLSIYKLKAVKILKVENA